MIYPTRRAMVLAAVGAPASLAAGLVAPGWWLAALGWIVFVAGLVLADLVLAPPRGAVTLDLDLPAGLGLGEPREGHALLRASPRRAPARAELTLEADERLAVSPERAGAVFEAGEARAAFALEPVRRGLARLPRLWARWKGPLGMVWRQVAFETDRAVPVTPNIDAVKREAIRLYARDAQFGLKAQIDRGEGSEFQSLAEFRAGMDPRTIDWKQSARHTALLAREFRVERNHNLIFALDVSRQMSDPLEGVARVDHAINAALMLAFVSLKMGDRAGLFAFDSRPRLNARPAAGAAAFPVLQRHLAGLDYSAEEVNYTLALASLSGELQRRSLVVVFTEFVDTTSAELMIEGLTRLARRHLVLFVAFRDEELDRLTREPPQTAEGVSRAVIAMALLKERDLVIARLRRLGVQVLDVPVAAVGPELVSRYLDLKRRELL